jgi:twitching motility two-component system response regulator PilH
MYHIVVAFDGGRTLKMSIIDRPTVVVVDDEQLIVEIVCEVLDDAGLEAVSCISGSQAVSCIRNTQPQLVMLDLQMPGVDGVQIFRTMRADPATRSIPVIFFTANASRLKAWLPEYRQMGATVLPKPFDIDNLVAMVSQSIAS